MIQFNCDSSLIEYPFLLTKVTFRFASVVGLERRRFSSCCFCLYRRSTCTDGHFREGE
jgi:hypothetical protein